MVHEESAANDPRIPRVLTESGVLGNIRGEYGSPEACAAAAADGDIRADGLLRAWSAEVRSVLGGVFDRVDKAGQDVTGVVVTLSRCFQETDGFDGFRREAYLIDGDSAPIATLDTRSGSRPGNPLPPDLLLMQTNNQVTYCQDLARHLPMPEA